MGYSLSPDIRIMDFEAINGILNCFWYNFYIHTQVSVPDLKKNINELRIMIILMSGDRLYYLDYCDRLTGFRYVGTRVLARTSVYARFRVSKIRTRCS